MTLEEAIQTVVTARTQYQAVHQQVHLGVELPHGGAVLGQASGALALMKRVGHDEFSVGCPQGGPEDSIRKIWK